MKSSEFVSISDSDRCKCVHRQRINSESFKILTEGSSKAPRRAVAVANYFTARAPPPKDIMAFGSVLQLTQHNIGESRGEGHVVPCGPSVNEGFGASNSSSSSLGSIYC